MQRVFFAARAAFAIGFLSLAFVSCGGQGQQLPSTSTQSQSTAPAPAVSMGEMKSIPLSAAGGTYDLPLAHGYSGTISLRAENAPPHATLNLRAVYTTQGTASTRKAEAAPSCPPPPTITLENPFPFPITIRIIGFSFHLPCSPSGALFGASFYQTVPQPQVVSSLKLGDAAISNGILTFTPAAKTLTFPAHTTSVIAVLAETSTSDVALPVAPGSTTILTSNAPNINSGINFQYTTSSGGTTYSSACFNAHDSNGHLVAALVGVAIAGIPSIYCNVTPATTSITFGQLVKFFVTSPTPDRNVFGFDGPPSPSYLCTNDLTPECNTPQFTVPTYQNLIVSNVKDMQACVPLIPDTDCNNVAGVPSPPPSTLTVPAGEEFQVLVADDPTYKPGTENAPVPWSGLFSITASGQCQAAANQNDNNGDVPPGYNDNTTGPYAELDVNATTAGTCTVTVSEDPNFITDFSNPANPVPRSVQLNITVQQNEEP
jgi:hypothetical protein